MGTPGSSRARTARALQAVTAAFVWSSYYVFVLWLDPIAGVAAVLVYPFLLGGLLFLGLALAQGDGGAFRRLWREPEAWARIGLVAVMQLATLAATYTAGPIDSSLLALLGDVIMVPLLLMVLFGEDRPLGRSPWFLGGVLACLVGGSLTIVAGASLVAVSGWALVILPALPLSIGLYFLSVARASRRQPMAALNAHAYLGASLLIAAVAPVLPGGAAGLVTENPVAIGLLAVLGISTFFLAPYLYFVAAARGNLVATAMWMSLIPAFTLLFSFVALGLVPTALGALGIPIAIAGAFLALEGQRRLPGADASPPALTE